MKTSNQTKATSIYRNQNVLIRAVFERAGDSRKVLCVALDYTKCKHVDLICDGDINPPFPALRSGPTAGSGASHPKANSCSDTDQGKTSMKRDAGRHIETHVRTPNISRFQSFGQIG